MTSHSHPLYVDYVSVGGTRGAIGMTLCPGKRQPHGRSGAWRRDLSLDLAAIKQSGATALVTLMEDAELESVAVSPTALRTEAAGLGIEWHRLPIRDAGVPDQTFEDRWTYTGLRLRAHLLHGRRVALHCLGGLGRSGTVAARLLVELGTEPEEAISAARAARRGAIETPEQEQYVRRCHALGETDGTPSTAERALACLLGGAVGDAFGYAVEFDRIDAIRARFGQDGVREPILSSGRLIVSDDTQMTLFTLEGVLRALDGGAEDEQPLVAEVRRAYLDWLSTQERGRSDIHSAGWLASQSALQVLRAPGNTCLSALQAGGTGSPERPINRSKGCGAVMRAAPLGLLLHRFDAEVAFRLAALTGALTHGHPSGYLSAGALAAIIRLLLDGADLADAAHRATTVLASWDGGGETAQAIEAALARAAQAGNDHTAAIRSLGEGWVGEEALAIGLYAALAGDTFADTIRIGANHDGDSDSTASIAGQLYGAWRGLDQIPHEWIVDLDVLAPLLRLSRSLEARQNHDEAAAAIDWATSYIERFQDHHEALYVDRPARQEPDGVWSLGWRELSATASEFLTGLYTHGLILRFDWPEWEAGRKYFDSPALITGASLSDCLKLLTSHARSDRFSEGHFGSVLERGDIVSILKRLRAIRQSGAPLDVPLSAWT